MAMKRLSDAYVECRGDRPGTPSWDDLQPEMKELIRDLWRMAHFVCSEAAEKQARSESDADVARYIAQQLKVYGLISPTT